MESTKHHFGQSPDTAKTKKLLHTGDLHAARDFAKISEDAARLRAAAPVLSTSMDPDQFKAHAKSDGTFRVGAMVFDSCTIITARLQLGGVQIVWLADASDSDVWRAIDNLDRTKQAGFVFALDATDSDVRFLPWSAPRSNGGALHRFRGEMSRPQHSFFEKARSLVTDPEFVGHMERESMLAGISLEFTRANILLTPRLKQAIAASGLYVTSLSPAQ